MKYPIVNSKLHLDGGCEWMSRYPDQNDWLRKGFSETAAHKLDQKDYLWMLCSVPDLQGDAIGTG